MGRWIRGWLFLVLLLPTQAWAQAVPVQQFVPPPGGAFNYAMSQGTSVLPHLKPGFGLHFNYAYDVLNVANRKTGENVQLLEHQLTADLTMALGLIDALELGLAMPATLYQAEGDPSLTLDPRQFGVAALGDLRIYVKWRVIGPEPREDKGPSLSFLALFTAPTGSVEDLNGNGSATLEPRFTYEQFISRDFRFALSVGYRIRIERQELFNIQVGNEFTWAVSGEYRFTDEWSLIADLAGNVSADPEIAAQSEEHPTELMMAARWRVEKAHMLTFGLGRGLTTGYGSPALRFFIGYNYAPHPDPEPPMPMRRAPPVAR